jgi:hypothetical protein
MSKMARPLGRPPVTDGPFAETKDLIAGWMVIDVDSAKRAVELAGELSAAPGAGGEPIHEWLEVRPFMGAPPSSWNDPRHGRRGADLAAEAIRLTRQLAAPIELPATLRTWRSATTR